MASTVSVIESSLTIERTQDWPLIKRIVTHEKVWPHVTDDYSSAPELWEPIQHESAFYVLVSEDGNSLGLFALYPHNRICWAVHTCLLPECYGETSRRIARESIEWVFSNTECLRIITEVPAYNRIALKFAKDAGMTEYGVNPESYMKGGKLRDLILLGISKCL